MNITKSRKKIFWVLIITAIAVVIGMVAFVLYVLYYDPPQPYGCSSIAGDYVIYTEGYNEEIDLYLYQISSDTTTKIFENTPILGCQLGSNADYVLWQNIKNDIYLYEIRTGITKRISRNGSNKRIDGDYVVWTDRRNNFKKVFLYQISTNTVTRIAKTENMYNLRLNGDYVLWSTSSWLGSIQNTYEIFLYQISTNKTRQIWNSMERASDAQISGKHIFWEGPENSIYLFDINSDSVIKISDNAYHSSVSNDYIIWDKIETGEVGEIYLYQISTGNTQLISNNTPPDAFLPYVYENYAMWGSYNSQGQNPYIYDLNTGEITEFFKDKPGKYSPRIDGDTFLWSDYSNHYVYLYGSDVIMKINDGKSTKLVFSPDGTWEIQE